MAFHEIQRLTQRTSGAQAARQYYRQAQGNQIWISLVDVMFINLKYLTSGSSKLNI